MPTGIDAGTVNAQVRVNTGALRGDLTTASAFFKQFAGGAVLALGAIGIAVVAVTKTIQGLKAAVDTFSAFEQSMANVASVAQASAQEMKALNDAAAEAGKTTRFTASQSADALYYLASAGFDATQSISALSGVLNLAGATGSDLASTSETVASTISQFSLEAEDATRVANVFTAAITNSQATMDKLAISLRYVGPVASSFNASVEETVGLLQILYNNGFAASQAGTALRGALADLSNASSPAIAKLKQLGLSFEQVNPATNSLAEVMGTLSEAGLEGADVMAIFGDRAGPAMIKLIQAGREEIEAYTEAVTGTNAAAEAYAIQNDTLAGAQDRFRSATESLAIAFGQQLAPFLRDVLKIGIALVNWLTGAIPIVSDFLSRIVFPVTALADFTAELVDGRSAADEYSKDLDRIGNSLDNVNQIVEANKGIHNQRVELDGLVDEYETLTSQTTLNADEQERLSVVIEQLARRVPDAATAFNEFGTAIEINTAIARDASLELLELEKANNEAALNSLQAEQWIAEQRAAALNHSRESAEESYKMAEQNVNNLNQRFTRALGIEQQYISERNRLLEEGLDPYDAQVRAAEELNEANFITDLQLQKVIDRQITFGSLMAEAVGPVKERYAELTEQLDDQYAEWQAIEGQYRRSNELLLEIKKTEQEIAGIEQTIGLINEQNNDNQLQGEQELEGERQGNNDAELQRIRDRAAFEEDYHRRRMEQSSDRLALLDEEYKNALAQAEELGADTVDVEAYYAQERIAIEKEIAEETAAMRKEQLDEYVEAATGTYETLADLASQFFDALTDLYELDTEERLMALETQTNAQLEGLEKRKNAELAAAGIIKKTEIDRLKEELAEAQKTGDKENIEKAKDALTSAEIDQKYADEEARINEEADQKQAQIEYEGELRGWKLKLAEATYTIPMMAMNAYNSAASIPYVGWILGPIAGAAALAAGLMNRRNIKRSKPQMAEGGIVLAGASGGTDVTVAENGYNEMMFNAGPSGRPFLNEFADVVVDRLMKKGMPIHMVLEIDGQPMAESSAVYYNKGIVRLELR